MGAVITIAAIGTILGLLRLTSPAVRALTYRKGAGWYLAPNLQLEATGLPADRMPQRDQHTPKAAIRHWTIGGIILIGLAILAFATGYPILGVVLGIFGLLVLGMAVQGWRTNRWLAEARTWNTGHRREIPPARKTT